MSLQGIRVRLLLAILLALAGLKAGAQQALVVLYNNKPEIVREVRGQFVHVMVDGKLTSVKADRSVLAPVKEYLPAFVSVRKLKVNTSYLSVNGGAGEINHDFHLVGNFESAFHLKRVFMVLELDTDRAGKIIYYHEIGDLRPNAPRWVEVHVGLSSSPLGDGQYKLHIFSDGREVLHSEMPWQYREHQLDEMVMRRIEGVKEAQPQPLAGPIPDYPEELAVKGVSGEVHVHFRVSPQGVVMNPQVEGTPDPQLAEKALAAIRLWRFLPKVHEGRPVATEVSMPFQFTPPQRAKKD